MALQVWLPFTDGTLKQQGLSSNTITCSSAVFENGKLNKCLKISSYQSTTTNITALQSKTNLSCCFWLKMNSGTTFTQWSDIVTFGVSNSSGSTSFRCETSNTSGTSINWYGNNYITGDGGAGALTITLNTWTHIAVVVDGTIVKTYQDGELKSTYTIPTTYSYYFNGNFSFGNSGMYCSLNDLRVYDNCLSPIEIKQISQGLMLHYTLSQSPLKLTLQYDTSYYQEPDGSVWVRLMHHNNPPSNLFTSSSTWTTGVYKNENAWYDVEKVLSQLPSTTSRWEFMVKQKATSDTTSETKYRWYQTKNPLTATWEEVNPSSGNAVWITGSGYANYSSGGTYILNSSARMIIANGSKGNWWGSIGAWNTHQSGIPAAGGVVVTTGYMDLYFKVADNSIEYDCSGFGNNGIRTGTFIYSNDTPKYSVSMQLPNGTDYIKTTLTQSISEFSVAAWVKPNSSNGGYSILTANYGTPSSGFWISTNCESSKVWFYTGRYVKVSGSLSNDVWTHICFTFSNGTPNWYINGVKQTLTTNNLTETSISISNLTIGNSYIGTSWNTKRYGNISDFRIYATALSADDVLSLYQNNAYIDTNNTIHGKVRN